MHVYAMRHGESEYNILGLCNDDPARRVRLTERGRRQACEAAERLRPVRLDCVYTSELPRTRETAAIVAGDRAVAIRTDARLNDIHTGCDGRPVEEYFRRIGHDRLRARAGDGETLLEHKRRVLDFLGWLGRQPRCHSVLLVAHEETLRVFAAHARGLDDASMLELTFGNCEILEFAL